MTAVRAPWSSCASMILLRITPITAKGYRYLRPGIEPRDWGNEMTVIDPFGNRI